MDLAAIGVFTRVVQVGSFSGAARELGMPKSTVSLRVAQLEARLGVGLLKRTTRRLHLTEAGRAYFDTCARTLAELEGAERSLTRAQDAPRGLLRISAGTEAGTGMVGDLVAGFLIAYPDVAIDLQLSSRRVDLVAEDVDVAFRAGKLDDSTLKARRLGGSLLKLFASPAYLARRSAPRHPLELKRHDCLCLTASRAAESVLDLRNGRERTRVVVRPRFSSNQVGAVRHQALAGGGIAFLPVHLCAAEVRRGELAPVLSDWRSEGVPIHLVHAAHRFVSPVVRAFLDHVGKSVGPDAWVTHSLRRSGRRMEARTKHRPLRPRRSDGRT
jgi:DNA-binding transcriptional LysR family regulator